MASVFDWMNATEPDQEIDAVPLWFQHYMETFKDEVVCEVSSKVVQSLGVVLDNKLSKLKIQNNNNQQQNRNKMTAKEVFQMKRRRNAARRIRTAQNQAAEKEKTAVHQVDEAANDKLEAKEDVNKAEDEENNDKVQVESVKSELSDGTECKIEMLEHKEKPQQSRRARPFLKQA